MHSHLAAELDRSMPETALAWAIARPGIASTLIGASKLTQLESNIAATDVKLSVSQMEQLNTVSAPPLGFSASLTTRGLRSMLFGGHSVAGWGE